MITLKDVLIAKYADKQWSWSGDSNDYSGFVWHEETSCPTEEELENLKESVETEKSNTAYKALRQKEYPSIGDQLDALFHAGVFPEDMATQLQAIKDAYPKPEPLA